jgi:hypothetical protein
VAVRELAGQFLADLPYWHVRPVSGGADAGGGCQERVLPEVIGWPPRDFVEQVGRFLRAPPRLPVGRTAVCADPLVRGGEESFSQARGGSG